MEEGTLVTFDGSGSTDNVGIVNYTWSFHDDGPVLLYGVGPSYIFAEPGIYVVTLNVSDEAGNWDTDTVTIMVRDVTAPVADAGPDQMVDEGTIVILDGSGSTDNVAIVNYTWTFIDAGVTKTLYGVSPTYRFYNPGVYEVTLTVRDAAGNSAADTVQITVEEVEDEEGGTAPATNYMLLAGIGAAIVAAAVVAAYLMKSRGKGGRESP